MRNLLQTLYCDLTGNSSKLDDVTQDITTLSQQNPRYKAIKIIPSFDPILTVSIVSEDGSGEKVQSGRQFSAWCGLVPKQNSADGKNSLRALANKLGSIVWLVLTTDCKYDVNRGFKPMQLKGGYFINN